MFILLVLLLSFTSCISQIPPNALSCETPEAEVFYYPFVNGKQLIEIDFFTAWNNRINCLEQMQPRALEWSMVIPAPNRPNIFMVRDSQDQILKVYNMPQSSKEDIQKVYDKFVTNSNRPDFTKVHSGVRNFYSLKGTGGYHKIFAVADTCYCNYLPSTIGVANSVSPSKNCREGVINQEGTVIIPTRYDYILPYDSLFITRVGDRYGVIDAAEKTIISLRYSQIHPLYQCESLQANCPPYGLFYALTINNKKIHILNKAGHLVRTFPVDGNTSSAVFNWLRKEYSTKK